MKYSESLQAYVTRYFGQPLIKLNVSGESVGEGGGTGIACRNGGRGGIYMRHSR